MPHYRKQNAISAQTPSQPLPWTRSDAEPRVLLFSHSLDPKQRSFLLPEYAKRFIQGEH